MDWRTVWILLVWLSISSLSFPIYEDLSFIDPPSHPPSISDTRPTHHRHPKHHHHHHHHHKKRRSLSSKEGENNRNKRIIQIKPYWPWP